MWLIEIIFIITSCCKDGVKCNTSGTSIVGCISQEMTISMFSKILRIYNLFAGTPCYLVAPVSTTQGPLNGLYEDSMQVDCEVGYVTHDAGPEYLTIDNFILMQMLNYTTTCQANGTWSKTMECASKCVCSGERGGELRWGRVVWGGGRLEYIINVVN